ncbi:MAG: VCBS domain-containing protein, partial [Sulfuricurvum sp.]|nr:VCBS domain-containing protein [Sulfuricurvum sp.]
HATGAGNNEVTDSIALIVTSRNTATANGTLSVTIVDDVPTAVDDTATTLAENGVMVTSAVYGNVLTNDILGADSTGGYINQITYTNESSILTNATITSGGSVTVDTINGSLTVSSTGVWNFTSDTTVMNVAGAPATDSFVYHYKDNDGDTTTAVKIFSITDTAPSIGTPVNSAAYEAALPTGTTPNLTTETVSAILGVVPAGDSVNTTFDLPTVLNGLKSGGNDVSYAVSSDGHTLTATANGNTVFTVAITNPLSVSAGYTFNLIRPLDHTVTVNGTDGTIDLPFTFKVTDSDGSVATSAFTVTVYDDAPSATQTLTVTEEGTAGAHNTSTTINTNADATQPNTIITTDGTYGHAVVNANGTLTYTPSYNGTGSIATNYSSADVVTYTTTLDDGTAYLTTVNVTVTPVSDAPGVTRDAATVYTLENTTVALGLNAPTVTDNVDQNGTAAGDNSELLSVITLSGIPSGAQLLHGDGTTVWATSTGAAITIVLNDGNHINGATGTLTMTTVEFNALQVLPKAQSATDFTVTMSVTEYEVDNSGNSISGIAGATSTTAVAVDVLAVTDLVDLNINGSDVSYTATIDEDTTLNLAALLTTGIFADLDGSESRSIIISGFPSGTFINGTVIVGTTITIALTGGTVIPAITIKPPLNFSGDMPGISVTLKAHDSDTDSTKTDSSTIGTTTLINTTIYDTADTVTLNLYVNPVADSIATMAGKSTAEDTAKIFLSDLSLTDIDGSESIRKVVISGIIDGSTILYNGATTVISGGTFTIGDGNSDLDLTLVRAATITPPSHSSTDMSISVVATVQDIKSVNSSQVAVTADSTKIFTLTVTPVGEKVGLDTNNDSTQDLTMTAGHTYTAYALEDGNNGLGQWFNLGTEASSSFDLITGWSNQDNTPLALTHANTPTNSEQTYAHLTFTIDTAGGIAYVAASGAQYQYYNGTATIAVTD